MFRKVLISLVITLILFMGFQFFKGEDLMSKDALIPREVLFGNPDKANVQISPDGEYISYIAPYNGVLNLYIAKVSDIANPKLITQDSGRGVISYAWTYNKDYVLYVQDKNGDENYHLYKVNLRDNKVTDLTPMKNIRAEVEEVSYKHPDTIIIAINERDPQYHDLYKVDLNTDKLTLFRENTEKFAGFILDDEYNIRFAAKTREDAGKDYFKFDKDGKASKFMEVSPEDLHNTGLLGFNKNNDILYYMTSLGRNTSALMLMDLNNQKSELIYENDKVDVGGVMMHPTEKIIQAISYSYDKPRKKFYDQDVEKDFAFLEKQHSGIPVQISRDLKDSLWIVGYMNDNRPTSYYLFSRNNQTLTFLFDSKSNLAKYSLSTMHPVVIKTRDDLEMMCYLTLPLSEEKSDGSYIPKKPVPLIFNVHGGPTVRDSWGLDVEDQWLANRGYAVLNVNYRGSSGFGKNFINAGNGEWGGKMHDDLIDAVNWAIANKITTKDQVCIYGGSYGGYAALVGLTFTPDTFVCGVDIVGVSDLKTLLKTIPPYWQSYYKAFVKKIGGDPDTKEGERFLASRSPLTFVDRIKKPLLIGQGANDPRVKKEHSDLIVEEMKKKNIPVTYALYTDEGHGFMRPENRLSFYALTEEFLHKHLGGRKDPLTKIDNTSLKLLEKGGLEIKDY